MITLRLATPQDAAALLAIYRPYVEHTSISFETEVPTAAEFRGRIEETLLMHPYLVAEEDGQILGYTYAHRYRERAAYDWTVESSIYLREDARGNGIGRRLYTALLNLLRAQGYHRVCAVITDPNPHSIYFHEQMGFTHHGTLPDYGYKAGAWYSIVNMNYSLLASVPEPPKPVPLSALSPELVQNILENC